jgi:hypothetical protein
MTVAQAVSFAAMRSANLAVEVRHLLKNPDVLEQRRTRSPIVAMFWLSSTGAPNSVVSFLSVCTLCGALGC